MTGPSNASIEHQWERVQTLLRAEVGETAYSTWLKPMALDCREQDRVVLSVPTSFMRDWVVSNYADRLRGLWRGVNPEIRSVALNVKPAKTDANLTEPEPECEPLRSTARPVEINAAQQSGSVSETFQAGLDPRFTFGTFVVGKPNEFAMAAAERIAESSKPPFNPLFLYGGVGLGKTHLMHAIGHRAKQVNPHRRVLYLSAEKFMYQFVQALRQKDTMGFKEMFRSVDLLMVDDVQFISGKDSTQEEFFHTFNSLVDRGSSIVISADRSPSDLSGLEERIRSRLGWGLVADIHPTTFELRLGILQAKAEQLGVDVRQEVLDFLATRITSNVRELEGALNRIVHQASLVRQDVTIEVAQDVLRDLLRSHERRVTIDEIQRAVVEHYTIRMSDMQSARRARAVARPRQVAMYLAKQLTPRSLPEIGKKFGGRDHTTVMHAVRQIEKLVVEDRSLADDVQQLRRRLQS